MTQVSQRLASLSPSETLAMSQKSSELKAKGIDVINLSVGETDFFTPDHIKDAARKAIEANFSFYSPVPGYIDLRQAIVDKLKRENGLNYSIEHIVVSAGAKQSVCNVLLSIINPGDEVIIPAPYWVSYVEMVKLAQGKNVIVHAGIEQDFKISAPQLEEAITPRTKALILCSPNNPTGSVYSADELKALADVLARHPDIIVLSDEIYEHINYCGRHESISQFPEIRDRVVLINGVSKAYAMTGWRIGFLAGPRWIAQACNKLQGQYTSSACSIAQKAAIAAFAGDQSCVKTMRDSFLHRRNLILDLCRSIPDIRTSTPQGTFYIFPDMSAYLSRSTVDGQTIRNAADLSMYILESGHVATVGGDAFGAPGHLRLSYAVSDEQLQQAVQRMKSVLSALK
jgi:aspartate aminotransferase